MLKKIALAALFAITFAVDIGAAHARTSSIKTPHAPIAPQGLCGKGTIC
ncbi:MAG TPA: hypothetical protein VN962_23455 [Polyangia bacterium]|nr:hypothetical protein [Polyangia bacterium]